MHVFGQWEEAGVPGESPHIHRKNMQTPQSDISTEGFEFTYNEGKQRMVSIWVMVMHFTPDHFLILTK